MVRQDQDDEQLREAQQQTGYGDDEGERDEALDSDESASERDGD
jgi:hypothetical protein